MTVASSSVALPQRTGRNAGFNMAYDVAAAVSALVVTPVLLTHLGPAGFGVWALAQTAVSYLELLDLGFGRATVKLVAERSGGPADAVVRVVNTNFFLLSLLGFVALLAGLALAVSAEHVFSLPDALNDDALVVFAVLAVALATSVPLDTFGAVLAGYQRYDLLSGSNVLSVVLTSIVSVLVVVLGGGLLALAISHAVVMLGMQAVRWRLVRRILPALRLSRHLVDRGRVKATATLSGWFLVRDLSRVVIHRIDVVVVGIVLDVRAAAVYAIGAKLAGIGRKAVSSLARLFFPYASSLAGEGDEDRLGALLLDGTRAALVVGAPLAIALGFAGPALIELWVGQGYGDAGRIVIVLALAQVLFPISETCWAIVMGSGHARMAATAGVCEAAVNLVASLILGLTIGVVGVAIGTVVGAAAVGLPVGLVAAGRATGVSAGALWRSAGRPHVVPTVAAVAVLVAASVVVDDDGVAVVATAAACSLLYLLTYLRWGATAPEREAVSTAFARLRRSK